MKKGNTKGSWLPSLLFIVGLAFPNAVYLFQSPDTKAATALLLSLILLAGLMRLLQNHPWLLASVSIVLAILAAIDTIHLLDYGAHISAGAIGAIFDTDPKEASEFFLSVSNATIPVSIGFAILAALLVLLHRKTNNQPISTNHRWITTLMLVLPIIDFAAKGSSWNSAPIRPIKAIYDYWHEKEHAQQLSRERKHFRFDAHRNVPAAPDEHFVLILGESVRRDHLQPYGYPRPTSPQLTKRDDLLLFTDVVSPANQTRRSVKMMLSPATALDLSDFYRKGTIVNLANEAGFHTTWLSNQGRYGQHDTEVSSIGRDADLRVFTNTDWDTHSLDERLISPFHNIASDRSKPRFTVVHLLGSHGSYFRRYPPAFDYFHDTPPGSDGMNESLKNAINAYDNSLRYTDSIIDQIIRILEKTKALGCAIYSPDHGEILGEVNGRTTHGFPTVQRPEAEIPFIVWCSQSYRQRHPDVWARLSANRHLPFSTEHLFDLLADMMAIDYPGDQPSTSIANPSFEPPSTRYLLGTNGHPVSYESFATNDQPK